MEIEHLQPFGSHAINVQMLVNDGYQGFLLITSMSSLMICVHIKPVAPVTKTLASMFDMILDKV